MNGYLTLIDLVVVAGAAVVLPLALGRWTTAWVAVAGCTALAFSVAPGPGALVWALPWPLLATAATVDALRHLRPTLDSIASVAAPGFAIVAGAGLVVSCGDLGLFNYGEPITRLAAVHFTFAGAATTALGRATVREATSAPRRRTATAGLVLALAAPPVVGLGFTTSSGPTHHPEGIGFADAVSTLAAAAQVGGAVLMALSAYCIAGCQLAEAWPLRRTRVGRLLAVSGLSVWVPMVLAVTWALGQHTGGPALSIPDMARIHGSLNAFGFVGCGLAARWLASSRIEKAEQAPIASASLRPA